MSVTIRFQRKGVDMRSSYRAIRRRRSGDPFGASNNEWSALTESSVVSPEAPEDEEQRGDHQWPQDRIAAEKAEAQRRQARDDERRARATQRGEDGAH